MKRLLLAFVLCVASPLAPIACKTAPSERVVQVKTLGVLGSTAKSAMDGATQLLKQGSITLPQWQQVANFYDLRFQPAFNLAVAAARSDLSTIASPDLQILANDLIALIASFSPPTPR